MLATHKARHQAELVWLEAQVVVEKLLNTLRHDLPIGSVQELRKHWRRFVKEASQRAGRPILSSILLHKAWKFAVLAGAWDWVRKVVGSGDEKRERERELGSKTIAGMVYRCLYLVA